jgi:hypothetical protein
MQGPIEKYTQTGNPASHQEGGRPTFPEMTVSVGNARVAGPGSASAIGKGVSKMAVTRSAL